MLLLPLYYLCYYSTASYTSWECRCNPVNRVDTSLIGIVIPIYIKVISELYNSTFLIHRSLSLYSNTPVIPCPVRSHSDMNPHLPYEARIALHTVPFLSGEPLTKIFTSIAQSLFPAPPPFVKLYMVGEQPCSENNLPLIGRLVSSSHRKFPSCIIFFISQIQLRR